MIHVQDFNVHKNPYCYIKIVALLNKLFYKVLPLTPSLISHGKLLHLPSFVGEHVSVKGVLDLGKVLELTKP